MKLSTTSSRYNVKVFIAYIFLIAILIWVKVMQVHLLFNLFNLIFFKQVPSMNRKSLVCAMCIQHPYHSQVGPIGPHTYEAHLAVRNVSCWRMRYPLPWTSLKDCGTPCAYVSLKLTVSHTPLLATIISHKATFWPLDSKSTIWTSSCQHQMAIASFCPFDPLLPLAQQWDLALVTQKNLGRWSINGLLERPFRSSCRKSKYQ